jgi:glycerol-3-phosphate dehydrogenase (NAD(P)+)
VHCARAVAGRARAAGVEMPIADAVAQLLDGKSQPQEVVAALMSREAKEEGRG